MIGYAIPILPLVGALKTCFCGNTFLSDHELERHCSRRCRVRASRAKLRATRAAAVTYHRRPTVIPCDGCGERPAQLLDEFCIECQLTGIAPDIPEDTAA